MKHFTLMALLLILGVAGANAQIAEQKIKRFPPIKLKKLDLGYNYLGKGPSAVLEPFKRNGGTSRYLSEYDKANVGSMSKKNRVTKMPIIKPDSSIKFPILALLPDSTTLYHMSVKKPD